MGAAKIVTSRVKVVGKGRISMFQVRCDCCGLKGESLPTKYSAIESWNDMMARPDMQQKRHQADKEKNYTTIDWLQKVLDSLVKK